MVKSPKNIYESSFFVMKRNVCGVVAMFAFLIFSVLCCVYLVCMFSAFLGNSVWQDGWIRLEVGNHWYLLLVLGILLLLTTVPLELGLKRWYYQLSCGRSGELRQVFYYFTGWKRYGKAIFFQLQLLVRKLVIFGAALFPAILLRLFLNNAENHLYGNPFLGILYGISVVIYLIAVVLGLIGGFYWNLRYAAAGYLFFEDPRERVTRAIVLSARKLRKEKRDWMLLYLSMLPFYFLCILVVPFVFLIPYIYLLLGAKGRSFLELEFENEDVQ